MKLVATAVLVAVVSTACSTDVSGSAGPDDGGSVRSTDTADWFNSCDLSDADIATLGLDPATEADDSIVDGDLAVGCGYSNDDVQVSLLMGDRTVEDLAAGFGTTTTDPVDGRDAVEVVLEASRDCTIGFASSPTAVTINLTVTFDRIGETDPPCDLAREIATTLAPRTPPPA